MNDGGDHRYRSLRALQHRRAYGYSTKHSRILSSLNNGDDVSGQLAALTELCELLSFSTEDSESSMLADQLGPSLVKLAKHESNPDIMLLSIRAITYLCDIFPHSSRSLVRHNAVPVLCQRLLIIEYLDVAEQCLQALEKISRDHPLGCLQSGAIMAVLGYIDFFSTSVQRTALSVVVNVCKKLPSENHPLFMEAVPRLCNLLQYEDQQLVELVASSLIKIVDRVKDSPEMLDELHGHGLIHQATHLLALNSRITLSQPIYSGLIGLVAKLASGSADAVRTLFELNIGSIIKDVLTNSDLSHGMPSPRTLDKNCIQVHEILKLLYELLPEVATVSEIELLSSKQRILLDQPDKLWKFGMDILPTLVQIAQTVLEKLSNILKNSFVKEGVFFAMDALTSHNGCSQLTFLNGIPSLNSSGKGSERCMCQAYGEEQLGASSEYKMCNIGEDSVQNLAQHIKNKYFPVELNNTQRIVTEVLQDLRNTSAAITDLLNVCPSMELSSQKEEKLHTVLSQVIRRLCGDEPISTFELIESGIIKALLNYLADGQYLNTSCVSVVPSLGHGVQKRFETFATISLSSYDTVSKDVPLSLLVRKLQSALSTVENFPVIGGYAPKQRASYATIPSGHATMYSCLRVSFKRDKEEECLGDYSVDVVTVDPFCSVKEIEEYLQAKVIQKGMRVMEFVAQASGPVKTEPLGTTSLSGKNLELMGSGSMSNPLADVQETADYRSSCSPMETSDSVQPTSSDTKVASNGQSGLFDEELCSSEESGNHKNQSLQNVDSKEEQCQASCSIDKVPLKLALYLEGEQLDYSSTLYQEILQKQIKAQHERHIAAKLWSHTYTVTYKRAGFTENGHKIQKLYDDDASDKAVQCQQVMPLIHKIFSLKLGPNLDLSGPTSDILCLLRCLEMMNSCGYHLVTLEQMDHFAMGKIDDLEHLKPRVPEVSQYEFVNVKLTDKLEQQMRKPSVVHVGAVPLWCSQLMAWCPFLFSFDSRWKYFHLAAFGRPPALPSVSSFGDSDVPRESRSPVGNVSRKKFLVCQNSVLESAAKMMDLCAYKKVLVEVEYNEEVGTGLGPTLEFYTLVSREFQKPGLGMWRGEYLSPNDHRLQMSSPGFMSTTGFFPRPWFPLSCNIGGIEFSDVTKKFFLLGQIVGKALQDGRVLDIPFSKAFYKLVIGKELSLCDIESLDPELGRSLVEFQALVNRQKCIKFTSKEDKIDSGFTNTKIEDLCLDFTLPGYLDYVLASGKDDVVVSSNNLEEYISLVLDATLYTGISRQVEAFKSGLNQVIPVKHLQLFTEEELECLLCGECDSWVGCDLLDHIKFDHGYTAGSPQILNLLEVISEFNYDERRSFLQFVTGTPRLPPGGLAALNPKLTIVRKHSGNRVDSDLPSVMTC